jgi:hypothetical protein
VSDSFAGLLWQGCVGGLGGTLCDSGSAVSVTWEGALAYCEGLEWGGFTDWRLPNVREMLLGLVDDRHADPAVDDSVFPSTPSGHTWSGTTYEYARSRACAVWMSWGRLWGFAEKGGTNYVRCVRSGP